MGCFFVLARFFYAGFVVFLILLHGGLRSGLGFTNMRGVCFPFEGEIYNGSSMDSVVGYSV